MHEIFMMILLAVLTGGLFLSILVLAVMHCSRSIWSNEHACVCRDRESKDST